MHDEARAVGPCRVVSDGASLRLDRGADVGEPETGSSHASAGERLKEHGRDLGRHAGAVVGDEEVDAGPGVGLEHDARSGMLDRVEAEVQERRPHRGIPHGPVEPVVAEPELERESALPGERTDETCDLLDHLPERPRLLFLAGAGCLAHEAEEPAQPVDGPIRLRLHLAHLGGDARRPGALGALAGEGGEPLDHHERVLELVGEAGGGEADRGEAIARGHLPTQFVHLAVEPARPEDRPDREHRQREPAGHRSGTGRTGPEQQERRRREPHRRRIGPGGVHGAQAPTGVIDVAAPRAGDAMSERIEAMKKFIEQDPANPFPRYALSMEHKAAGDLEEAARVLGDLVTRVPGYVATYLQFGMVLEQLGRLDEARDIFTRGIEQARAAGNRHALGELEGALAALD